MAHLDNPSLSALSVWETLTHPVGRSLYHTSVGPSGWAPQSLKNEHPPVSLLVSSPAKPGATLHSRKATKGRARSHQAPPPPEREGAQKIFIACPLEGVAVVVVRCGVVQALESTWFISSQGLFIFSSTRIASHKKERRLSFLLQSPRGSVAQGGGRRVAVTTPSLLMLFLFKIKKTREGTNYHISEITSESLFTAMS